MNTLPDERIFKPGQLIVEQGEPAMEAYLLLSGEAEVFLIREGREFPLAKLGEGEIFGEAALFKGSDYGASVRAISEVSVQPITPAILDEKIRLCDPMIRSLIRMLMVRLRRTNEAAASSAGN